MSLDAHEEPAAIHTHIGAVFISLELSRSRWLITSLVPGGGQRMSRRSVAAGDLAGLLARFWAIRDKASVRTGICYPIIVIQEAGLDGFWIHRALEKEGIESHVVDAASIAVSRRRRRAKTDRIDGEALLRVLLAFKRGEPRVCSRTAAGFVANARRCWSSGSGMSIGSKACCFLRGSAITSRCAGIDGGRWRRFARATGGRWART
jgi:transposase